MKYSIAAITTDNSLLHSVIEAENKNEALGKFFTENDITIIKWDILPIIDIINNRGKTPLTDNERILRFIYKSQKITAIREYRILTGCSLSEAKNYVNEIIDNMPLEDAKKLGYGYQRGVL